MKDPLIRRFLLGSCFTAAFVWVAVYFFGVEIEIVKVLFVFCVIFVIGLIFAGLLLSPIIRLFRSEPTLLSSLRRNEDVNGSRETE